MCRTQNVSRSASSFSCCSAPGPRTGRPDLGEFYTAGANYYVYGNNFKIQSDVTFTPEAAYTDAATSLLQNTHDVIFRLQVQMKF